MDNFRELSLEEQTCLDGGSVLTGIGISGSLRSASMAVSSAIEHVGDFISGFGDGFIQGFKETNQKW